MLLERMASELDVPVGYIAGLAQSASHRYKTYGVPKRSGGVRVIHHPSRELKALQRWLLRNVLAGLPVHAAATAYQPTDTILENAAQHASSRFLLRMDIKNFFPSITANDLRLFLDRRSHSHFGQWTARDRYIFVQLVCRHGALTIGAPTSPTLSNALCFDLDVRLAGIAEANGATYTRYADDLFFSTTQPNILSSVEAEVERCCEQLDLPGNLRINKAKTRHSSKNGVRRVTGIILGSDGNTYVGRKYKRRIRAMIHKLDTLSREELASLSGLIAYVIGFDKPFLNSLVKKYGPERVRVARFPKFN